MCIPKCNEVQCNKEEDEEQASRGTSVKGGIQVSIGAPQWRYFHSGVQKCIATHFSAVQCNFMFQFNLAFRRVVVHLSAHILGGLFQCMSKWKAVQCNEEKPAKLHYYSLLCSSMLILSLFIVHVQVQWGEEEEDKPHEANQWRVEFCHFAVQSKCKACALQ